MQRTQNLSQASDATSSSMQSQHTFATEYTEDLIWLRRSPSGRRRPSDWLSQPGCHQMALLCGLFFPLCTMWQVFCMTNLHLLRQPIRHFHIRAYRRYAATVRWYCRILNTRLDLPLSCQTAICGSQGRLIFCVSAGAILAAAERLWSRILRNSPNLRFQSRRKPQGRPDGSPEIKAANIGRWASQLLAPAIALS